MKRYGFLIGAIGLVLFLYGIISAIFYSNAAWYSYFTVGGTFFLAYLNSRLKNKSLFGRSKVQIAKTYGFYLIAAIVIELIGRFWLHLWAYPSFNAAEQIIHVFLIGYPFIFFFINELLALVQRKVASFSLAVIITTLAGLLLSELPNLFASEWQYTIPYITFEILHINIVVIFGWVILVAVPILAKKMVR
jgi:hypothetical protein